VKTRRRPHLATSMTGSVMRSMVMGHSRWSGTSGAEAPWRPPRLRAPRICAPHHHPSDLVRLEPLLLRLLLVQVRLLLLVLLLVLLLLVLVLVLRLLVLLLVSECFHVGVVKHREALVSAGAALLLPAEMVLAQPRQAGRTCSSISASLSCCRSLKRCTSCCSSSMSPPCYTWGGR
jgi:hypothetical protein